MSLKLHDIVNDPSPRAKELLDKAKCEITQENFRLKDNYLSINFSNFHAFNILELDGEFVAFSGLQKRKVPDGFARLSTRMYISKKYRSQDLRILDGRQSQVEMHLRYPGSLSLVPYQIKIAKHLGLNGVFISREYPDRVSAFNEHMEFHNSLQPVDERLTAVDGIFNICEPRTIAKGCWQRVCVLFLNSSWTVERFKTYFEEIDLSTWKSQFKK
jgi:hypothetical protein